MATEHNDPISVLVDAIRALIREVEQAQSREGYPGGDEAIRLGEEAIRMSGFEGKQ